MRQLKGIKDDVRRKILLACLAVAILLPMAMAVLTEPTWLSASQAYKKTFLYASVLGGKVKKVHCAYFDQNMPILWAPWTHGGEYCFALEVEYVRPDFENVLNQMHPYAVFVQKSPTELEIFVTKGNLQQIVDFDITTVFGDGAQKARIDPLPKGAYEALVEEGFEAIDVTK